MTSLIVTLFVLGWGWHVYRSARQAGTWSNKKFFAVLLAVLALAAIASLPIFLVSASTIQAHQGLAIAGILLAITVGVILITAYASRWRKYG